MTSKVLGGNIPTLKKGLIDEYTASKIFIQEVAENVDELRKHGLFFSFTTDPFLPETKELTYFAIGICQANRIPVKILTKMGQKEALEFSAVSNAYHWDNRLIAYGVTLTGCDNQEHNAPNNKSRIMALRDMKLEGHRTFASIEPIIDLDSSLSMIMQSVDFCKLFKVGLMSGKKYDWRDLRGFMLACTHLDSKFYFKDTFIKQAGLNRENLPANCVGRDYNIFETGETYL